MAKTTHLIEKYTIKDATILCVCTWFGLETDFREHQKTSPPTHLKVEKNNYSAGMFMAERRVTPLDEDFVRTELKNA